uniref:Octopamine receptor n=2 Tax=Cacopsylla melanoneura TaxID=428564 RepID=A0A8D8YWL3_9HEMI
MSNFRQNFSGVDNFSADLSVCVEEEKQFYPSAFLSIEYSVPEWEAIITMICLSTLIIGTIIGNIMVVISVFTYKPLRIVQNFFIVSLAVADLTVAIFVLPINLIYYLSGRWIFGIIICKIWLTCDVLCCTASILNLCAIALDRYWAITDPIVYAQQRTIKRVNMMILYVWLLSALISSPPLIGWNDWPEKFESDTPCQLTKQRGYVVYSSLGSFFIPLVIMTLVYVEIFLATKKRLRDRAKASKLNIVKQTTLHNAQKDVQSPLEAESVSSETDTKTGKHKNKKRKKSKKKNGQNNKKNSNNNNNNNNSFLRPMLINEDSITDIQDLSSASNKAVKNDNTIEEYIHINHNETANTISKPQTIDTISLTSIKSDTKATNGNNCHVTSKTRVPNELHLKSTSVKSEVSIVVVQLPSTQVVKQFIEEKQKISLSKERRAARTLGIIMGVFVFCWLPFFLMYVSLPFCDTCCMSDRLINFITWLGYINSGINPIIYTIFNLDFRKSFKRLLNKVGFSKER